VSKQHAVIPSQVFELEDGSSSYKDFSMTRNNRFSSAGQASKNIIQPPSAVLHFYNVPPCVSQDHLLTVGVAVDVGVDVDVDVDVDVAVDVGATILSMRAT